MPETGPRFQKIKDFSKLTFEVTGKKRPTPSRIPEQFLSGQAKTSETSQANLSPTDAADAPILGPEPPPDENALPAAVNPDLVLEPALPEEKQPDIAAVPATPLPGPGAEDPILDEIKKMPEAQQKALLQALKGQREQDLPVHERTLSEVQTDINKSWTEALRIAIDVHKGKNWSTDKTLVKTQMKEAGTLPNTDEVQQYEAIQTEIQRRKDEVAAHLKSSGKITDTMEPQAQQALVEAEIKKATDIELLRILDEAPDEITTTVEKHRKFTVKRPDEPEIYIDYAKTSASVLATLQEAAAEKQLGNILPTDRAKQAQTLLTQLEPYHDTKNGGFEPKTDERLIKEALIAKESEVFDSGVEILDNMLTHIGGLPRIEVVGKKNKKTKELNWEAIRKFDPDGATGKLQLLLVTYHDIRSGKVKVGDTETTRQMLSAMIVQEIRGIDIKGMQNPNLHLADKLDTVKKDQVMEALRHTGMEAARVRVKNIIGKAYGTEIGQAPMADKYILRDLLLAYGCRGKDVISVVSSATGHGQLVFKNKAAEDYVTNLLLKGEAGAAEIESVKALAAHNGELVGKLLSQELGVDLNRLESSSAHEQFAQETIKHIETKRGKEMPTVEKSSHQQVLQDVMGGDLKRFKDKKKRFNISFGGMLAFSLVGAQFLPLIFKDEGAEGGGPQH